MPRHPNKTYCTWPGCRNTVEVPSLRRDKALGCARPGAVPMACHRLAGHVSGGETLRNRK
jgi:hypothetical protein